MAHFLRPRVFKDWKALHQGTGINEDVSRYTKRQVLPDYYNVERLILRKQLNEESLYLVKWEGYDESESTWEPESNLTRTILDSYEKPSVSDTRLLHAAKCVEEAVRKRLHSRKEQFILQLDLDIYRHCFGSTDGPALLHKKDFDTLPMSEHWFYYLNSIGEGRQIRFPVKLKPNLRMRRIYVKEDRKLISKSVPRETVTVTCSTCVCDVSFL